MKISQLLLQRETLLRQAYLANLAFAYWQLAGLVARLTAARLRGPVRLLPVDPGKERYSPALVALAGSQAVIEEHFTDENVQELSDLIDFVTGEENAEKTFRLEELAAGILVPLRQKLEQAGVEFAPERPRVAEPEAGSPERK